MRSPTLRFQELLRRLGVDGSEYPEILESVQPVVNVGDLRGLVPSLAPPTSMVGGFVPGGGTSLTEAAFQLRAGPLGTAVHLRLGLSTNHKIVMAINPHADVLLTLAGPITAVDTVLSLTSAFANGGGLTLGTANSALINNTHPAYNIKNGALEVDLFVPGGTTLEGVITSAAPNEMTVLAICTLMELT